MPQDQTLLDILLTPPVLITFMVCVLVAALIIWLRGKLAHRQTQTALSEQRRQQETTIERLLDATTQDKEELIAEYEAEIRRRDTEIAALEEQVARLRDRIVSGGVVSLFGGKQRDMVAALLLENEQLHELLAKKQEQLRDTMADMTEKLIARMDEQAEENARAIRYKQALLSAFLERSETRELLNRMLAEGKLEETETVRELPEGEE